MDSVDANGSLILIRPGNTQDRILCRLQLHEHGVLPSEIVPLCKADVMGLFHAGPLSAKERCPLCGQLLVPAKAVLRLLRTDAGRRAFLLCIAVILARKQIQPDQIAHRSAGPSDHAVIAPVSRLAFFLLREPVQNLLIPGIQRGSHLQHAVCLQLMTCMIDSRVKRFRSSKLRKMQIIRKDLRDLLLKLPVHSRQLLREVLPDQMLRVPKITLRLLSAKTLIVIRKIHEILQKNLMEFHVAHVDDPELSHAVVPCLRHLLPDL